jgi:replicative DNA helicase
LRSVIYLTGEVQRQAYDEDDAEELIADLDIRVSKLADLQADDEIQTARQAVDAMLADRSNPRKIHRTGISQLDTRLRGGLRDGQVVVVGGRPGAGKSVLLVQIATGIATAGTGEAALIVTLEMLKQEICERLAKTMTGDEIAGSDLLFIDSTSDLETITALCRVACRRHRVGVIVIDYLQLCEVKVAKGENRERQIATMSRRLKRMANSLRVPVVVGSQLNRASTTKAKPSLADLRESGSIEQDADIVILLSNDDTTSDTLIQIAKQRGGATSEFTMRLNGPQFRFEGVEETYYGEHL